MPSIQELKKVCYKPKKYVHNWYTLVFARKISIYFTWLFIHTPVTPNQLTIIQILLPWIGSFILILFKQDGIIPAIILYQLGFIFDSVDGEVARYKKKSSLFGVVLDSFGHVLITPAIYWGITLYIYFQTYDYNIVFIMILLSIFLTSPTKHALMRGVFFLTTKKDNPVYSYNNLQKRFGTATNPVNPNPSLFSKVLKSLKFVSEYPNDMNVFSILLLLNLLFKTTAFATYGIYFFFGLVILKEIYFVYSIRNKNLVEKEYLKIYQK